MTEYLKNRIPSVLLEISTSISEVGGRCCLVGGWVRDALLNIESKDYDVEVYGIEDEVLDKILRKYGRPNHVGKAFGITLLMIEGVQFDFAFPRSEIKTQSGHRGFEVETDPYMNFVQASSRRDFTINAMGLNLPELSFEDPWHGRKDLEQKLLRHVGPAFGEDPLRALRAIQFSARFQLEIPPETIAICAEQDLSELSVERVEEEFRKLWLKASMPGWGLKYMQSMNLLRFYKEWCDIDWSKFCDQSNVLSRLNSDESALNRELQFYTLSCMELSMQQIDSLLLKVSRLRKIIDDVPGLVNALRRLKDLVANTEDVIDGDIRRLALRFPLGLSLPIARATYLSEEKFKNLKSKAQRLGVYDQCPKPLLSGKDLITLGIKPGPHMGEWIQKAFELELDGELQSKEESIEWLKRELSIS